MSTETVRLHLHFKGKRNYITGADIARSMLEIIGPCTSLRIEFHHMAACALMMREVASMELPALKHRDDVYALMACKDLGGRLRYWIAEAMPQASELLRVDYDESVYTRSAVLIESSIQADADALQSNPVDALVALNKHLLNHCIEVHPWIFVRLDLQQWPFDCKDVQLKLVGNASQGIYRTTISSNGNVVGSIYFTRRSAP
jgi:hypothetical protein